MKNLSIAIPEKDAWLLDTLAALKTHEASPGASVGAIVRGILRRELRAFRVPSRRELALAALADNGFDPSDPW